MKKNHFEDPAWYNINVIIMAGGKGSRLSLLTENTPKSLIEISEKPVIHHLIEHLVSFGISSIYISVGHLSQQIIENLGSKDLGADIKYIHETFPMGSIGALTLKTDWEHDIFLVLNGDILTNFNLTKFISNFLSKDADAAVLTQRNEMTIPWGVLYINTDGRIIKLVEKPKYNFQISAGIYLFKKNIIKLLSNSDRTEGWELIQSAINQNYHVVGIPVDDDAYWIDIGTSETLQKALNMAETNFQIST